MIKVVKLVTGEDVVADVECTPVSIILKNPQRFMMTQEGIGSIPLVPFSSDSKYEINMNHVVLICEPDQDIKNGYNAQHGSGIVIPTNDKIIQ